MSVLLTGAAGVVGRAGAAELRDDHMVGLVHHDADMPEVDEVLRADLTQPLLGLGRERWDSLASEVHAVVHSAALTEYRSRSRASASSAVWTIGQPIGRAPRGCDDDRRRTAAADLAATRPVVDGRRPPRSRLEGRMTLATRMERLDQAVARAVGDPR